MANAFTIPSIFKAIDKMTGPIRKMQAGVRAFATSVDNGVARSERIFRKLTPVISETSKQFLSFASTAAIAGAIVAGVVFSVDSIKQYETAVASFRTIVGGSDKEFSKFQDKINEVAKDTKKSSVDTALAFEKIASLNAKFADTADHIGAVSKAAITLSKASGDELGPSAESLVGIMNQFGFAASQADRTINVLAAGAGVGAASIVQTSEAFVNFGSVAKGANLSLEESVGLIQTLGKYSVFGAEAGTKLRGSILKLQQAGIGYKSGQFKTNDALAEAAKKIDKLRTAKEKDAAILKIFGAENIATGKILLANTDQFAEYTKGVTGTTQAQEQAIIRSNTLANTIDELKNSWVNMITGSNQTSEALIVVKDAIRFVTEHLDTIVSVGIKVLKFFVAFKAIMLATKIAVGAYNIVLGISAFRSASLVVGVGSSTLALQAQAAATNVAIAAQWLWNAAMSANPLGILIIACAALVAGIAAVVYEYKNAMAVMHKKDTSAFAGEINQVAKLQRQYEKMGMSKDAALKKAVGEENKRIETQRGGIQKQITEERAKGAFGADMDKLKELARKDRDLRVAQASINDKGTGDLTSLVNEKEALSTKGTQAEVSMMQKTQTNNAEVLIKVDAPEGTTAKSNNKTVSIVPKIGSTMPSR